MEDIQTNRMKINCIGKYSGLCWWMMRRTVLALPMNFAFHCKITCWIHIYHVNKTNWNYCTSKSAIQMVAIYNIVDIYNFLICVKCAGMCLDDLKLAEIAEIHRYKWIKHANASGCCRFLFVLKWFAWKMYGASKWAFAVECKRRFGNGGKEVTAVIIYGLEKNKSRFYSCIRVPCLLNIMNYTTINLSHWLFSPPIQETYIALAHTAHTLLAKANCKA